MSTLNENDVAIVTDHQGEKRQIILTPQLVNEALKLPNEGFVLGTWQSQKDKAGAFKQTPRQLLTYANLKHQDTKLILRLYHQHFEMGRMARYTQLAKSLANILALISRNLGRISVNFFVPLCEDIKKFAYGGRWLRDNFINSPHVLTRIIYFALDLQNQLPQTQEL